MNWEQPLRDWGPSWCRVMGNGHLDCIFAYIMDQRYVQHSRSQGLQSCQMWNYDVRCLKVTLDGANCRCTFWQLTTINTARLFHSISKRKPTTVWIRCVLLVRVSNQIKSLLSQSLFSFEVFTILLVQLRKNQTHDWNGHCRLQTSYPFIPPSFLNFFSNMETFHSSKKVPSFTHS